ncbi:unnamed protein product [Brassica oleracea var. botrytis]
MEVFKDESQVIYKYVGMSGVSLRDFTVALMQLLFPIDEFYVGYVMVIITLGISIACSVVDYDLEEVMPFGCCAKLTPFFLLSDLTLGFSLLFCS